MWILKIIWFCLPSLVYTTICRLFQQPWVANYFYHSITIHKKRCTRRLTNHCIPRCTRAGHIHTPCRYLKSMTDVTSNYLRHYIQDHFSWKWNQSPKRPHSSNRHAEHKLNAGHPWDDSYAISKESVHNCRRSNILKKKFTKQIYKQINK